MGAWGGGSNTVGAAVAKMQSGLGWSQERKQVVPLEWQAPWMSWPMQCDGHVARGMRAVRGQ